MLPERWQAPQALFGSLTLLWPVAHLLECHLPHKISLSHTDVTVCCSVTHTPYVVTHLVMCILLSHTLGSCTVRSYIHLESTCPDLEITHPALHTLTNHTLRFTQTWKSHTHTHASHRWIGSHLGITIRIPHSWISFTLRCQTLSSCTPFGLTHSHHRIDVETTYTPTCPLERHAHSLVIATC